MVLSQWSLIPLYVEVLSLTGDAISRATCFDLGDPDTGETFLVSNRHVATGRHQDTDSPLDHLQRLPSTWRVYHHDLETLGEWQLVEYDLYDNDNRPLWREHPTHGRSVDVVALPRSPTDRVRSLSFPWQPREPRLAYGVGSTVFTLGYPLGHQPLRDGVFPVWTRGSIASEPDLPVDGLPLMLIDARTRHGQSGSPVILHSGRTETTVFTNGSLIADGQEHAEWLGVYSGRTDSESDLGRVWHADATRDIARHGIRPHTPWGEAPER